jgi:hypothetical protein
MDLKFSVNFSRSVPKAKQSKAKQSMGVEVKPLLKNFLTQNQALTKTTNINSGREYSKW